MIYSDNQYIIPESLYWKGLLNNFSKSRTALQPIFEAFTNAIEAIKIKQQIDQKLKGEIIVNINLTESTVIGSPNFSSISISDNGIGFDDEQFKRFNTFRDITKGFKNLGSGRIQYVLYFDNTVIKSVFKQDDKFYEREFTVSKKKGFLEKNSIVLHRYCKKTVSQETRTIITFNSLLENSPIYNKLNENELKEQFLKRYVHYFCHNKSNIPKINIKFYLQSELKGETSINQNDIPNIDKSDFVELQYSKVSANGKFIEKLDKIKEFKIDSFKIQNKLLDNNDLKLVSKGEIVEESEIKLENIPKGEHVKGFKYIFLVSSDYIDERDTDMRGVLNIPTLENFTKNRNLFTNEEILIEEIQESINSKIGTMYPEIEEVKQQHIEQLDKLKEMFLLDDETAKDLKLSINDSESKILEKFYEAEAKKSAIIDASIKESVDNLNSLDTNSPNYIDELKSQTNELIRKIPLQNKMALSHYVARRKLVIELFKKILDKEIEKLISGGRIDEDIMHNLIFQQSSRNSENSDLWLIEEEFIYFKGFSEHRLDNIELNGKKLFKEKFTEEEERYLKSLGENRLSKRPDVLLFPEEGKCILIEFKAPDVNVAEHLSQIDFYSNLIRNYTIDEIQITSFYGYLIGEAIEDRDVRGRVTRFEHSYHLGFWFRPSESVVGYDGRKDGNLYTEVIKFTTLLERAKLRSKIFIDKLGLSTES